MNEYRHYRGRGRGNFQHSNNYRNQIANNIYGSDVRRCNPNHFTQLLPFPPFRETRPRWQRPPQQNWRGTPRHFPFVRAYSPPNKQTKPLSPLPGSEEARQKAIAEASARIKQQLNLAEGDPNYGDSDIGDGDDILNISDDCIILNESPLQGANHNKANDKKRKNNKSTNNSVLTPTIEELRKKILTQFTYMSKGKIQNLVNNPGSTRYDNALQHLVRDMRLHLSSELRNMYANRDVDPTNEHTRMIDHFNSIVPDLGIELVSLPDTMVAELSKILQLDVNNEIEDDSIVENENVLVEPEDMFKQAQKLLSSTDFLNASFDLENTENDSQTDDNNYVHLSPIFNHPPPNIPPPCTIISNADTQLNQSEFQSNVRFDEDAIVYNTNNSYLYTNEAVVVPVVPTAVPLPLPLESTQESTNDLEVIPLPDKQPQPEEKEVQVQEEEEESPSPPNISKNPIEDESSSSLNVIPLPEEPPNIVTLKSVDVLREAPVRNDPSPFSKKILQDPMYEDAFKINVSSVNSENCEPVKSPITNTNTNTNTSLNLNKSPQGVVKNKKNILFNFDSVWISNANATSKNINADDETLKVDSSNNKLNVTSFLQDVITNNLLDLPKDKDKEKIKNKTKEKSVDKRNNIFISETSCESSKSLTEKNDSIIRPFNRTRSHSPYDLNQYNSQEKTTKSRLSLDERIKEMMKIQETRAKPKDQMSPGASTSSGHSQSSGNGQISFHISKRRKKRERKLMNLRKKKQRLRQNRKLRKMEQDKELQRLKQIGKVSEIERLKEIEREKQKKIQKDLDLKRLKEMLKKQQQELEKELLSSKKKCKNKSVNNTIISDNTPTPTPTPLSRGEDNDTNSLTSNLLNLNSVSCNLIKPVCSVTSKIPIKLISKTKSKVKIEPELIETIKIKEEPVSADESNSSSSETETESSTDNLLEKNNIIHNLTKDILNPSKLTKNIRHFENIDTNLNITNKILETPIQNFKIIVETNPVLISQDQTINENDESQKNFEDTTTCSLELTKDVVDKETMCEENIVETEKTVDSIEKLPNPAIVQEETPVESSNETIEKENETSEETTTISNNNQEEKKNETETTTTPTETKEQENKSSSEKKINEDDKKEHSNTSNNKTSDKKHSENKKSETSSSHKKSDNKSSSKKVDDNKKHRHGSVERKKDESSKTNTKYKKSSDSKHRSGGDSKTSHHHHHHHSDCSSSGKQKTINRLLDIDLQIQKLMQEKWNLYKELNITNIEQLPSETDVNIELNRSKHSKMPRINPETKTKEKETTTLEINVKHISTQTDLLEHLVENSCQKHSSDIELEGTPKKNKHKETKKKCETPIKDIKIEAKNKRKEVDNTKKNTRKRKLSESNSSVASSNNNPIQESIINNEQIINDIKIDNQQQIEPLQLIASGSETDNTNKNTKTKRQKAQKITNNKTRLTRNSAHKIEETLNIITEPIKNVVPKLKINLSNVKSKTTKHKIETNDENVQKNDEPNKIEDEETDKQITKSNKKNLRNKIKVLENEIITPNTNLDESTAENINNSRKRATKQSKKSIINKDTSSEIKSNADKKDIKNAELDDEINDNTIKCDSEIINNSKRKSKKVEIKIKNDEIEDKHDEINDNITIKCDTEITNTKRKSKKVETKTKNDEEQPTEIETNKKNVTEKRVNRKNPERRNSRNRSATPSSLIPVTENKIETVELKAEENTNTVKRTSKKRKQMADKIEPDIDKNKKIKLSTKVEAETDTPKIQSDEEVENLLGFNVENAKHQQQQQQQQQQLQEIITKTPRVVLSTNDLIENKVQIQIPVIETKETIITPPEILEEQIATTNNIINNEILETEEMIEEMENEDNKQKRKQIKHNRKLNKIVTDEGSTESIDNIYIEDDVNVTSYDKLVKTCFVQLERINVTLNKNVDENESITNILNDDDDEETKSFINEHLNDILLEDIDFHFLNELKGVDESPIKELDVIDEKGIFCQGHQKSILDIKIVGDEFFAASEDGTIYKYCLKTGTLQDAYTGHKRAVTCIYTTNGSFLNIDSTLLYSGSLDCSLKCYNIETAEVVHSVTVTQAIQCLDSAWGYIFLGTYEGLLFIYDMKKKILNEHSLTIANATVLMIKATQEGSRQVLILASRKREIMVRDAFTGLLLRTMCEEQKPTIYSLLLDRSMVYCGTSDKGILILDFNNGQQVGLYNSGKGVVCMLMHRSLLFAGCYDGLIYIYNTKTQQHVCTIPGPGEGMLLSLAISNDVIIAGSKKDHLLKIWKIPQEIFNQID